MSKLSSPQSFSLNNWSPSVAMLTVGTVIQWASGTPPPQKKKKKRKKKKGEEFNSPTPLHSYFAMSMVVSWNVLHDFEINMVYFF